VRHLLAAAVLMLLPGIALAQNPPPGRFLVVNAGSQMITLVQASPVTDSNWGENLIGRIYIPPGATLAVSPRERDTCLFDLRITWADGRRDERRRENFCGQNRIFRVDGSTAR